MGRIVPMPSPSPTARLARGSYRVAEDLDARSTAPDGSGDYHADPRTRAAITRLARSADRNASLFAGPITRYIGYLLGDGSWPRPRLADGANVDLVEDWKRDALTPRFDASGRFSLPSLLKLWIRGYLRDGDTLAVHDGQARTQLIEGDRIMDPSAGRTTDRLVGGISQDRLGTRIRFWIADYDRNGRLSPTYAKPYDAQHVTYTGLIDRSSQQRGICVLGAGLDDLDRLDALNDAEIKTAEAASRHLAYMEREKGAGTEKAAHIFTDAAALLDIPAGRKIVAGSLGRPNLDVPAFTRLQLRIIFLCLETPLELLLGELNDLNYSAARSLRNLSEDAFGMARRIHLHPLLDRLWREWCQARGIEPPAVEWEWPRLQIHDRNKEIEADSADLANETTSRMRLVGSDWKRIMAELSAEDRERDRLLIERITEAQKRCNELNADIKGLNLHWSHLLAAGGARSAPGAYLQGAKPDPKTLPVAN